MHYFGKKMHKTKVFLHKSEIVPLKILDIRTPAANIIKQEMLACGGDCAIPAGCVVCAEERVDVILLGTYKHYTRLLEKLTQMPYFGMAGIKSELMAILDAPIPQTILSDGRILNYDKMLVMGILNITPDSFYAGSRVPQLEQVVEKAGEMLRQGAAVLDIGGESTRPGCRRGTKAHCSCYQGIERALSGLCYFYRYLSCLDGRGGFSSRRRYH